MYRTLMPLFIRMIFVVFFSCLTVSIYGQGLTPGTTTTSKTDLTSIVQDASANLDQCANGDTAAPTPCISKAWQNGNLGKNTAHYLEGESVPYRLKFIGLVVGDPYTVTIEWDTTENGKHALDYLTSFNETETTADPCSDVPGCVLSSKRTYAIPMDPNVAMGYDGIPGTADDVVQKPGVFSLYGGTINTVSPYTMTGTYAGSSQTSIQITFIADAAEAVLAWGGHISTRMDWGVDNSAIAIEGSPYHMRFLDLNGSGGNQDRSLSSEAAIFPGSVTIIKDAWPASAQVFAFTASGPGVSNFSLVDNGSGIGNTQPFTGLVDFGVANSITVTEDAATGLYSLSNITCVEQASGGMGQQNSTVSIPGRYANIILEEGESVTCTFVNAVPTAAAVSLSGRVYDPEEMPIRAQLVLTNVATGSVVNALSNQFGYYQFEGLETETVYMLQVSAKGYLFEVDSQTIILSTDLTEVNFVGQPIFNRQTNVFGSRSP